MQMLFVCVQIITIFWIILLLQAGALSVNFSRFQYRYDYIFYEKTIVGGWTEIAAPVAANY
jgi:hypothetical protein